MSKLAVVTARSGQKIREQSDANLQSTSAAVTRKTAAAAAAATAAAKMIVMMLENILSKNTVQT